jgi:hypothetical protein
MHQELPLKKIVVQPDLITVIMINSIPQIATASINILKKKLNA